MTEGRRSSWLRPAGVGVLAVITLAALAAPFLAPHAPNVQFADRAYAPPMRIHIRDAEGYRAPFVYRQVLEDRLSRRYREDTSAPLSLTWLSGGRLASIAEKGVTQPLLVLGADALGRDVLSRLVYGARWSLGVTIAGVLGALALGVLLGGLAGATGGWIESGLMWTADFLLALPGAYLVLVLRGVLPAVLSPGQVFALMASLFAFAAWPHAARGVRAITAAERARDYAEAARASGAGSWRLMWQLVPAAQGFLAVEILLLVPALLVAEATISYLGLGFPDATASWGTMLQDAANVRVLSEAPWMLAPAVAIFIVVFSIQMLASARSRAVTDLLVAAPSVRHAV